jgi:hypothetical protein
VLAEGVCQLWWDRGDGSRTEAVGTEEEARALAAAVDELRTEAGETLWLVEAALAEWRREGR